LCFTGTSKSKIGHPVDAAGAHARPTGKKRAHYSWRTANIFVRRNTGFTFRKPY
jgi:hypothetical protein